MKSLLLKMLTIALPILMGLLFIGLGLRNHSLGKASENWPSVQGNLVGESSSNRKKRAKVFYQYQVEGVSYKNSRVNFRDDKASKKRIRDQYQVGDALKVYYKPDDPEQSVLEPGATFTSLLVKIFGGLFCFGLSGFFLLARKR